MEIHVTSDFDGTITTKDTMSSLASVAYDSQRNPASTNPPPWQYFVDSYLAEYSSHKAEYTPKENTRRTVQAEADWLRSLRPVEIASLHRVKDSGLFDSVTVDDFRTTALKIVSSGQIPARRGWMDFVKLVLEIPMLKLDIISVNWSRLWIREYLRATIGQAQGPLGSPSDVYLQARGLVEEIHISAGATLDPSVGAAKPDKPLFTSHDKLQCFNQRAHADNDHVWRIYLGDSMGDLECLVAADVGIVMAEIQVRENSLDEVLSRRLGITTEPLTRVDEASYDGLLSRKRSRDAKVDTQQQHVLYVAKDFDQFSTWFQSFVALTR